VNASLERKTGKPTLTAEELSLLKAQLLEQTHTLQEHSVHNGFCYTCQQWL
jgi:hypothetical protein